MDSLSFSLESPMQLLSTPTTLEQKIAHHSAKYHASCLRRITTYFWLPLLENRTALVLDEFFQCFVTFFQDHPVRGFGYWAS
ncbi:uncharacterized protein ARMOST_06423 [Armillaria ostoyae]|uniref:Uncharacterized protein n=1 Tax=Armillaria ostoyae TaxID=47428 RepID=A0A284R313_ARMOS|nr:uncharacterized protein ARMOST_06423 [Armillaria ostoyae]